MKQIILGVIVWLACMPLFTPGVAAQSDPVTQCAEGVRLFQTGQAAEALVLLEPGFTNRTGASFPTPNDLGECALALGQLRERTGDVAGALEAYQVALDSFLASSNRQFEAYTLMDIGYLHASQSRYTQALDHYLQALAIYRDIRDQAGELIILKMIGSAYWEQGRYTQALDSYQQSLALRRAVGYRDAEENLLNDIGLVYEALGQYAEAIKILEDSLAISRQLNDWAGAGVTLSNLAHVYWSQGRYAEAVDSYQQALAMAKDAGDRSGEGLALVGIGTVYVDQGRYAEALQHYEQALEISREIGERAGEGIVIGNIGEVYSRQGRYEQALAELNEAAAILREVGEPVREAVIRANIGSVQQQQGRYEEALASLQQALDIYREAGDRAREGVLLNNIGSVYRALGRTADSLEMYQQALAIAREVGDPVSEGHTLTNLGLVDQSQGHVAEALGHYEQAMDVLETVRATAGSEAGRTSFIAQYASVYENSVALLQRQGRDEEAFFTSERGRARAFLDSLATGQVQLSDSVAAGLLARAQAAYARYQAARTALARANAVAAADPQLLADLQSQVADAQTAYAQAQSDIQTRRDQLPDMVPGQHQNVLDVAGAQALLDAQTTLVSYFVLEDKTLAFVLTRNSFQILPLNVSRAELNSQITLFRDFSDLTPAHPDSAITLYRWLIEPLKAWLTTPHLAIVPHGVLHYLPFAALTDGQRYLIDDYVLSTLPSASALPFIQKNTGRALANPLILGNPTTGDFDATTSLATQRDGLGALPFAEQEAKAIAALYEVEPLLGQAATESIVRQRAGQAGILHLAAHGYYNPAAPLSSLMALAPDGSYDGWLTVGEIYGLDLSQADLVVLSACETQLGQAGLRTGWG